jgi:serine/threonine-protein kinase
MKDADAVVERTIARCLEFDPRRRHTSAQAVANALAGGDPLQAALAAGLTPSPEMVAAAGESEAMNPRIALVLVVAIAIGLMTAAAIAGKGWVFSRVASETPPDAMAQKARDALAHLGYRGKPFSSEWGYQTDATVLERLSGLPHEEAWRRIAVARPPAIAFWYRESPERLAPSSLGDRHVLPNDPPFNVFGMIGLRLDPQGRLCRLVAYPPSQQQPAGSASPFSWLLLFESAGLDMTRFEAVAPRQIPFTMFDERGAWLEKGAGSPLRVEAAAWRGLPVWFVVTDDAPLPAAGATVQTRLSRGDMAQVLFSVFLLLTEGILAWRNLKLGRGDTQGAWRLGAVVALFSFFYGLLSQGHALDFVEYRELLRGLGSSLLDGARMAAAYLAFEPFIRRRWPDVLISWTRMLGGAFRDPLVGRHLLIGLGAGVGLSIVYKSYDLLLGPSSSGARSGDLYTATNTARTLGHLARCFADAIGDACWCAFLVFIFALVLRKRWAAAAGASVLWGVVQASGSAVALWTFALWMLVFGILYLLLFRYGLLACFAYAFAGEVIMGLPVTLDTGAWYFGAAALAMATLASAAWFAFRAAVAGRAVWSAE